MIQYFVNILPFEKRLSKLRDLETEENELRIRVEDISSKLNLSNSIIKSIDSVPILEKAKSNQGDFIKELGTIHKRMKEVSSIKERLLKCEDIQKAIKKGGVKERFQKTKDLFKRNVITQKVWKESYKVLTGSDKVCYSDVIVYHCGKILLLERSKIGIGDKNIGWCVPGGHVDPGEDFIQAAERELREETGIVLSEGCQLDIRGEFESDEIHIVYFEVYLQDEPTLVLDNEEHKQYCWADPRELDQYPMIFDMAQNLQAILGTGEVYVTKIEDVSKAIEEDEIEKGRKAQIGEVREWKDGKWQKTKDGWIPYKGGEKPVKYHEYEEEFLDEDTGEVVKIKRKDPVYSKEYKSSLEKRKLELKKKLSIENQKINKVKEERDEKFYEFMGNRNELNELGDDLSQAYIDQEEEIANAQKISDEEGDRVAQEWGEKLNDLNKQISEKQELVNKLETISANLDEKVYKLEEKFQPLEDEIREIDQKLKSKFEESSDREKNPFHNKELKKKLGKKALQSIRDGKMGEYTKVVAADYGLTFREAIDLLAESTRLAEDSENKVGDSISEDFSKINKEAVKLWMDATNYESHSKEKKSLIEQARRKVSEGFNGLTKDLPAKEKYDLAGKLIVQFKNPLVASALNSIQEGLRHSINIEAMSPRHGL